MATIKLCVPKRFEAQAELPRLLAGGPADLTVFPEGFLRSQADLELALALAGDSALLTGWRDGNRDKAVLIENRRVADEYTKCILTAGERAKGKAPGTEIRCLKSRLGRLAAPICYEVHFPEVCRAMALEDPVLMVNIIGTGMYHRLQYDQWRALARARAIENELPVVGCCHFCGEIPLAFAFDRDGTPLLEEAGVWGAFTAEVDLTPRRPIGYLADRRPELFGALCGEE